MKWTNESPAGSDSSFGSRHRDEVNFDLSQQGCEIINIQQLKDVRQQHLNKGRGTVYEVLQKYYSLIEVHRKTIDHLLWFYLLHQEKKENKNQHGPGPDPQRQSLESATFTMMDLIPAD